MRRHLARLICGAFTNRQATAAAKSHGLDSAEAGRATLRQLRLLCLEHIETVFSDRKEIARCKQERLALQLAGHGLAIADQIQYAPARPKCICQIALIVYQQS